MLRIAEWEEMIDHYLGRKRAQPETVARASSSSPAWERFSIVSFVWVRDSAPRSMTTLCGD